MEQGDAGEPRPSESEETQEGEGGDQRSSRAEKRRDGGEEAGQTAGGGEETEDSREVGSRLPESHRAEPFRRSDGLHRGSGDAGKSYGVSRGTVGSRRAAVDVDPTVTAAVSLSVVKLVFLPFYPFVLAKFFFFFLLFYNFMCFNSVHCTLLCLVVVSILIFLNFFF